ncbi:MAG: Uma2 family endonuclease [Dehalococcoidia bacterium]|nr:Uma2 family endonuclease [Dehalococcoidia bacterium]
MAAPQIVPRLTAEEFWKLPGPPHGGKMELVEGEVVIHMPVGGPHSELVIALGAFLLGFARSHGLGPVGTECGFVLARNPDIVFAPDLHFVRSERLIGGKMPAAFFDGVPDLAVEVVSPDDTDRAVNAKVLAYLAAGTPLVWVVRPEAATVTVHRPNGDAHTYGAGDVLGSADAGFAVEGFSLALAELFA